MLPKAIPDATRRPSFRTAFPQSRCAGVRFTPALCPGSALLGCQVAPKRNQNLSFSATLHRVHKSDIWD